jgi:hypothetical protein
MKTKNTTLAAHVARRTRDTMIALNLLFLHSVSVFAEWSGLKAKLRSSPSVRNGMLVASALTLAIVCVVNGATTDLENPLSKLDHASVEQVNSHIYAYYNGSCVLTDYVEETGCSVNNTGPNCTTYLYIGGSEVPFDAKMKPAAVGQCSLTLRMPF